ncbi:unnamed protein product [Linum tenue]|uniref:Uncharacterized protein n=1 Tax=Linum tenue TaxID=586396 RepID=A0AAV0GVT7_9ROSI|nr:unnamed protein product [Linum tenue]
MGIGPEMAKACSSSSSLPPQQLPWPHTLTHPHLSTSGFSLSSLPTAKEQTKNQSLEPRTEDTVPFWLRRLRTVLEYPTHTRLSSSTSTAVGRQACNPSLLGIPEPATVFELRQTLEDAKSSISYLKLQS